MAATHPDDLFDRPQRPSPGPGRRTIPMLRKKHFAGILLALTLSTGTAGATQANGLDILNDPVTTVTDTVDTTVTDVVDITGNETTTVVYDTVETVVYVEDTTVVGGVVED